jgi:inner membrane protein
MKSNVMIRLLVLLGLFALLAISLAFIRGAVSDRKNYRDQVVADVARTTAGEQTLLGPVLVIPYSRADEAPAVRDGQARPRIHDEKIIHPESLEVSTNVGVETRHRGIHRAQVYRATNHITATFSIPPKLGIENARALSAEGPARAILGVSDSRGLHRPPSMRWDGVTMDVVPGTGATWLAQGIQAEAGNLIAERVRRVRVEADLELIGTNRIALVPVGASTRVKMDANWPDPSFEGSFLPDTRSVSSRGFQAQWTLSRFATGVAGDIERLKNLAAAGATPARNDDRDLADFGVRFMEPVDIYQRSERAVKYGILFMLLTFAAFFVFEVLGRMSVHPMQYLLAGSAVTLFFLLLLSLSEHIAFGAAYVVAAGACITLLTYYVTHVLGSLARGLSFAAILAVLYGMLYVILQSQDYALLLGTLLLFGFLSVVMVVTRKVDWYKVGENPKP